RLLLANLGRLAGIAMAGDPLLGVPVELALEPGPSLGREAGLGAQERLLELGPHSIVPRAREAALGARTELRGLAGEGEGCRCRHPGEERQPQPRGSPTMLLHGGWCLAAQPGLHGPQHVEQRAHALMAPPRAEREPSAKRPLELARAVALI